MAVKIVWYDANGSVVCAVGIDDVRESVKVALAEEIVAKVVPLERFAAWEILRYREAVDLWYVVTCSANRIPF